MSRKTRTPAKMAFWAFLLFIPVILVVAAVRMPYGEGIVRNLAVRGARSALGADLYIGSMSGNPVVGYRARDIVLTQDGLPVLSASELTFRQDIPSILQRRIFIKRLDIRGGDVDLDRLAEILPDIQKDKDRLDIPLDTVTLGDCVVRTRSGQLDLHRANLRISDFAIDATFRASVNAVEARGKGRYRVAGGLAQLENLEMEVGRGHIEAFGTLRPNLAILVRVAGVELLTLGKFWPSLGERFFGPVLTEFRIEGKWPDLRYAGNLSLSSGRVAGIDFEQLKSTWTFDGKVLSFHELTGNAFGHPVAGSVSSDFSLHPNPWQLKIKGEDMEVSRWKAFLPWIGFLKGQARSVSVDLQGPLKGLSGQVVVEADAMTVASQDLTSSKATFSMEEGRKGQLALSGNWLGSPIRALGPVTIKPRVELDLRLAFGNVDFDRLANRFKGLAALKAKGNLAGEIRLLGPTSALRYEGQVRSENLVALGETMRGLRLPFSSDGKDARVKDATALWQGGKVNVSGLVGGLFETHPRLDLSGRVTGIEAAQVSRRFEPLRPLSLSGKIYGPFRLTGETKTPTLDATLAGFKATPLELLPSQQIETAFRYQQDTLEIRSLTGKAGKSTLALSGKISRLSGKPEANLSGRFSAMDLAPFAQGMLPIPLSGETEGSFSISGALSAPLWRLEGSSSGLSSGGLDFKEVLFRMTGGGTEISLEQLAGHVIGGTVKGSGKIRRGSASQPSEMDLEASLEGLDLREITNRFSLTLPLKGKVSGQARIKGPAKGPLVEISAAVPELAVSGLLFKEVQVRGDGVSSGETLHIREARALVGDSPVTAKGTLLRGKEGWELSFSMEGSKLDLQNLVPRFISGSREIVKGVVDAKASGRINADGFQGSGRLQSPSLELWGFHLTDVDTPFVTTDEFVTVESGTARAYGGDVKVAGSVEMGKARWGARMTVTSADLAPALKDALKTEGTVSGKADLTFRIANEYGKAFLMDGNGSLRVKDGAVEGFSALKSLVPITGSPSIRYSTVNANFNIDGKSVFLLPGTRANAVPGDRFYRYLSVDGSIGEGGNLDLKSYGEINVRALNLLLGGLEGLLSSDGSWSTATLQQFLGGILGGATRRDFQEVSFNLKGPWRKPTIGDLKVIQHPKESPIPTSPSDPTGKQDQDNVRITITIPTGEGESKTSEDAGSQIGDQLLEQIIRQILKPGNGD